MTRYSVVNNETGEIMLETDSRRLQAANKLLQGQRAPSRPYGIVRTKTYKQAINWSDEFTLVVLALLVGFTLVLVS